MFSVGFLVGSPITLLWILLNRTELTEEQIIHRNLLPVSTRKSYSEVSRVTITRRSDIRIEFVDGTKFTIRTGENRLGHTIRHLERHVSADALASLKG